LNRFGLLAILFTIGTVWGLTIPLTKIAVSSGHAALGIVFWELVIGTLMLGSYLLLTRQSFGITRHRLLLFAVVTLTGTIIPGAFSYRAAAHLPAGVMAIVIALVPLFALPIAVSLKLETLQLKRVFGVILGAFAVILIVGPENALPDSSKVGFVLLAMIAPICYGFEGNYVALRNSEGLTSVQTVFGASLLGIFLVLPLVSFSGEWVNLNVRWGVEEWALLAVITLHIVAYAGYLGLVRTAGSVFASQVAYIVTITGVLWSIVLLSEGYSLWIWASLICLLLGVSQVLPNPKIQDLGAED